MLKLRKYPIEHPILGPPIHTGVDRVPVAEPLGQTAPFAPLLGHVQDRVQHSQVREAHVSALGLQTMLDQAVLCFGDFHSRRISQIQ